MGQILGFLARECGWDKDFIAEHFTLDQIQRYYEVLNETRAIDYELMTISVFHAVAAGNGNMKIADFNKFLEKFRGMNRKSRQDVNKTLRDMKKKGFNIEEV